MASSTAKDHLAPTTAQPAPSSSSAEDESRRKNTDCVYFLASPLTCKKGNECEFRHSEYARVNPRDCWYWLNGNCLNPKCSFRHPPLDTLPGPPADGSSVPGSSGFAPVSSLPAVHPAPPAPYAAAKPTVPCIFFQKGYCLKGDLCPFSHMPNPIGKKAPEFHGALSSGFSSFNSAPGELRKCSQLKPVPQTNAPKPIEVTTPQPKPNVHAAKALPRNGALAERHGGPPFISNGNFPKHKETASLPHSNGNSRNKPSHAPHITALDEQRIYTRKETDDLQRESSPGFDVLVDDELGSSDYFRNEDQFPGVHGHEEGELGEFEIGRRDRYSSPNDFEPVVYHDRYGYDNYESKQEKHARDRHYTPSDSHHDGTKNTDLRNRLSKQRRTDGIGSVVVSDSLPEERRYRGDRRDSHVSSLGSRLQGRIKLPPNRQSESEYDKGRSRGRIQDRLRGRIQDEALNFSHPKGLVERGEVFNSIGKRKVFESSQPTTEDLSFEAPKPLSEILKRKRKAETTASPTVAASVTEDNSKPYQPKESAEVAKPEANEEEETDDPNKDTLLAPKQEADKLMVEGSLMAVSDNKEAENDEGLVEELNEGYEEEEQYEGEGEEGGGYEEGAGGEVGDEYMDEDDGENFAKKIGVMFG